MALHGLLIQLNLVSENYALAYLVA